MTETRFLARFATIANAVFNSTTANSTAITSMSIGGQTINATPVFTGNTTVANLAFSGTGGRITGDLSNSTMGSRVAFQTSTVNGATAITTLPNGTAQISLVDILNSSDGSNNAYGRFMVTSSEVTLRSLAQGTGTLLPITFWAGSSERMRITTNGDVGIGTSSPIARFTIVGGAAQISPGNTAQEGVRIQRASGVCSFSGINHDNNAYNALTFATGASEAIRIDTSGNVGIGTSSPDRRLKIGGAGASFAIDAGNGQLVIDPVSGGFAQIDVGGANALRFNTNGAERMRIDTSGRVTKPFTPAFTGDGASKPAGTNGTYNGYTVRYNNGSHFNGSTGRFTAPISGIYYFFGRVQAGFSGGYIYWDFRRNGTAVVGEFHTNMSNAGGVSQWHDAVGSVAIDMSANDTMEMFVRDNNGGSSQVIFNGFLIG